MNDDKFKFYEKLFNICIQLNDHILKKDEKNELTFIDHYLFQATSYVISLIHNDLCIEKESFCKCFVIRSLIECLAVISMYMDGDIPEEATEMINNYNYIAEYQMYKKYKNDLDKRQFDFDQILNNFNDTKKMYRDAAIGKSSEEFKKIINSKVPFLMETYSFDAIIQKYLPSFYKEYQLFSIMIHPNDLLMTGELPNDIEFDLIEVELYQLVLAAIFSVYLSSDFNSKKTLRQEVTFIANNPFNNAYLNAASEQSKWLYKLAELTEKQSGDNTQSYFFRELGNSIVSMAVDKTFGFSEIVKCKFKMVVEMLALNYYVARLSHCVEDFYLVQLITKQTRIKVQEVLDIDTTEKWNDAYEMYNEKVAEVSFEEFKEIFSTPLGFIPDRPSINKLSYKMIEDMTSKDMVSHMKMVYDEAQLLSHANGYMIVSNSGAFMEYSSVIPTLDIYIATTIRLFITHWEHYNSTEGEGKYKKYIYDMKKCLKNFEKSGQFKNKLDCDLRDLKVTYDGEAY